MRDDKHALRVSPVMQEIIARPLPYRKASVKLRNEPRIEWTFYDAFIKGTLAMQIRIAPHHDGCAGLPTSAHRLPCALVMPTVYHYGVKALTADDVFNLGSIETSKTANLGRACYVVQKAIGETFK